MFSFLRRYQRAIFFVITVVIILSFTFFGTYSSVATSVEDPVLFTMVDGSSMRRQEFNDYVRFLGSDSHISGEGGFFNPLNDGALTLDIVQSGVGDVLADRFSSQFLEEWVSKSSREKAYTPYQHPTSPFVSALQIWNYFAPDIKEALEEYQDIHSRDAVEIFRKKAALYVAERGFPPIYLRQVLAYQQRQFQWIEPDAALDSKPLGLFGYNQLSDWFGIDFVERSCEFIMKTAAYARTKGLFVSQAEASASLYKNVKRAAKRAEEGADSEELFKRALRELHMDRAQAAKIWADVLLFRKALIELPNRVVLSKGPFDEYLRHQSQMSSLSCFQLQPSLRLQSLRDLMKFEVWKNAVSSSGLFELPVDFHDPSEVLSSWPELVERPFILNVSSISNEELIKRIRLRDVWNWEVNNWEQLAGEFSQLREEEVHSREEKIALLDRLAPQIRAKIDEKAKASILKEHSEWKDDALEKAEKKTVRFSARAQGGPLPFEGIDDRAALLHALLEDQDLSAYTQDNDHFYRIQVLEKSDESRIVSLPDALDDGTLDLLLDRLLEASYGRIKGEFVEFRDDKGSFKPFNEVKDRVGEIYFSDLLSQLDRAVETWREKVPEYCQWDETKAARVAVYFLPHLASLEEKLKESEESVTSALFEAFPEDAESLTERPLHELWSLVRSDQSLVYHEREAKPHFSHLLQKEEGFWSSPRYSRELGPFVARVDSRGEEPYDEQLRAALYSCQEVLGTEAIRERSAQLIQDLFDKETE